jgi:protein-disulfide isomerase
MAPSFDGNSLFVLTGTGELVMYDTSGKALGSMKVDPGMDQIHLSGFQKAGVPEQIFVANSTTGQIQRLSFSLVAKIDLTGSPFLGNADAPVALVVYSDFQ